MSAKAVFTLSGNGVSVTYDTGSGDMQVELDSSYAPFDGSHGVGGGNLASQSAGAGTQLTWELHHDTVGRGGPVHRTLALTLFLPAEPESTDSTVERDATGALVAADPAPRFGAAPSFRAAELSGTVTVAADPPGRF